MTGFTTGTGGTIGGPPTPQQYEQQTSAAQVNAQARLGITSDMLEHPITQMHHTTVWKYLCSSNNPNLVGYLTKLLVSRGVVDDKVDPAVNAEFERLWEELPEDLRQRYNLEMTLPEEERDPSFGDLRATLQTMALAITWIRRANAPIDPQTETGERNAAYMVLPDQARQGMIALGEALLGGMQGYLQSIGHNDPNFETLSQYVGQFQAALGELQTSGKADLSKLVGDLENWTMQLAQRDTGENMRILELLLPIMSIVTAVSALETGSAPLLLGLSVASIGIGSADKSTGILSSDLLNIAAMLSEGMLAGLLPNADKGSELLLETALSWVGLGTLTLASLGQTDLETPLQFELHMLAALSSGVFDTTSEAIAAACGADDKTIKLAGAAISLTSVLLIIQAYAGKDAAKAAALVESFKPYLEGWIGQLEPYVSAQAGNSSDDALQKLNVLLQQGKVDLDTGNYDDFISAMQSAFQLPQGPDMESSGITASMPYNFMKGGIGDSSQPSTSVFQG